MTRTIVLVYLLTLTRIVTAQDVSELDNRKGFKDIKLVSLIDSVKGTKFKKEFKEKGNVHAKLYEVDHPDYASIGEVKVRKIELKTYKDLVYEIAVHTEKDPRLMKAMESVFGAPQYDAKNNRYFWKTDSIILTFESHSRNQLQLVYTSFVIFQMMKDDKNKKVDEIADDF
jgi:hypothetical protein